MKYRAAAFKTFIEKYFKKGFTLKTAEKAPIVLLNSKNKLHDNFIKNLLDWTKILEL